MKSPKYFVVQNENNAYDVMHEDGWIVRNIPTEEAAKCLAMLCCLGHMENNEYGDLTFVVEPDLEVDLHGIPETEDELSSDDGPTEEVEDDPIDDEIPGTPLCKIS
jgi:hypothetical protein